MSERPPLKVCCMVCCTRYCAAEAQFDRKVAERDLRRYRRRGADPITLLMLAELRRRRVYSGMRPRRHWYRLCLKGEGCLANATRCGRVHCYFTGPLYILAALYAALSCSTWCVWTRARSCWLS